LLLLISSLAFADPGIDVQQFHPAAGANSYFSVDSAFPGRHLELDAGVYLNYAHRPLLVERGNQRGAVITNQLGLDVLVGLSVLERLEIALILPAAFNASRDNSILNFKGGIDSAGLGDLTLDISGAPVNARVHGHHLGLAIGIGVTAPTGDTRAFAGSGSFTGKPRLVFEWRMPNDRLGIAAEFGAILRDERQLGGLDVTHQLMYGLGIRVDATHGLAVIGEARGLSNAAAHVDITEIPFELTAGLRWRSSFGLQLEAAGSVGMTTGYGTPDGRFIFGLRYFAMLKKPTPAEIVDRDRDGVPDNEDQCPNLAGPRSNRGCPVSDIDGDGVDDSLDKCPNERGPASNQGCPEFDSDQDGIPDSIDKCPETPGPKETGGCPNDDRDHDGVIDAKDRCPDQPGSPANDGCPDVDSDGDGIVDRLDKCPFDPEVFNGVADDDGCPDPGPALAEISEDHILIKEPIQFNKAKIDPKSHRVLSVVAKLLELHPEIKRLRVEAHTDNKGSAIDNLDLSKERAAAVRRHLVDIGGIDGKRLVAQGFGPDRPIAKNDTEANRAKNRRIEFVIIEKQ
jgi:hypothetical protein